jgi:hypothetical protein
MRQQMMGAGGMLANTAAGGAYGNDPLADIPPEVLQAAGLGHMIGGADSGADIQQQLRGEEGKPTAAHPEVMNVLRDAESLLGAKEKPVGGA